MGAKRGKKGLFEEKARLAWMLDVEQSYRSAEIREWGLVDLVKLERET